VIRPDAGECEDDLFGDVVLAVLADLYDCALAVDLAECVVSMFCGIGCAFILFESGLDEGDDLAHFASHHQSVSVVFVAAL
jgi:hypothetical protein